MREYLVSSGDPAFLEPAAVIMARLTTGDDLTARSPLGAIPAYAGRPLAIVHGVDDATILVSHAEQLHAAAEAHAVDIHDYWLVPGSGHTRAVVDQRDAYEPRLVRFFTGALGAP